MSVRDEAARDPHGGPLDGLRVVEMEAIGPLLHAGLMLADLGADVIRVMRPVPVGADDGNDEANSGMLRGGTEVAVDLTDPDGLRRVRDLVGRADVLMEGSRPGTMEKLGLGPDVWQQENPGLIYGRMSGWARRDRWPARPDTTSTTSHCPAPWGSSDRFPDRRRRH